MYEALEKPSLEDLQHYGVLGMKWGVRRTPEQLGHHKIPKGTTMYRVSIESKANKLSGATYVTYLPPDRDLYRGSYSEMLKRNQGGKSSEKVVENSYQLVEDLNVPSRDELRRAYSKVMSNDKLKMESCKALAKGLVSREKESNLLLYSTEIKA